MSELDSSNKEKVFSGVFWKFNERILAQGISFLVSVILTRILMPEDYGTVALVLIFISLADVFVTSGFSTALVQKKDATDIDFSTIFFCSLIISFILYFILFFLAPFIATFYKMDVLKNIIKVFALRLPLSALNSVQHAYVSRNMIFKKFFFSTLVGTVLSGVVGISMAYKGFGVWALVAQYFTNTIVDTVVLSITIKWHPHFVFSKASAKKLMSYGWKVLITDLSGTFFNHFRSLLVGKFYSPAELAFYNKGTSMANLLSNNIYSSVTSVLFPVLSNESDNYEKIKSMFRRSVKTLSYLIFPILGGFIAIAKPFVLVVFTQKWESSIYFIQILCMVPCIELVGHLSIQGLKATNNTTILLKNEIINKPMYIICLIIGCFTNIKILAITMLISSFMGTIINVVSFKKIIDYRIGELLLDIKDSILLSLLTVIPVYFLVFLPIPQIFILIIQIVVGISFYLIFSIFTNNESFNYIYNFAKIKLGLKK